MEFKKCTKKDKGNDFTFNRRNVYFNHALSIFHSIFSIYTATVKLMEHPAKYCCVGISPPLPRGFKCSQFPCNEQRAVPAKDDHLGWPSSRFLPLSGPLNQLERDWEPLIKMSSFYLCFLYGPEILQRKKKGQKTSTQCHY